ncbi:cobyrinate a,c-diamide synthase [Streptomyces monomycini]|uniref:cobyrinate a,c-diamide synthase n=1 Tax=Streptomyces monomycini TaxID=371720 RepID=UPI0004AA7C40|nr:cobyrinate a,c-diamide synthase [Streptomyces monomycini]
MKNTASTDPAPRSRPAFVVAATHSSAGKTTVTAILLRLLRERGLRVQAFKIGPDFIDPGYHREITGRPSINLDLWMTGAEGVRRSFDRWSAEADVCVIEAMGGLYDGENGTEKGSAAHIAKLLGLPVVVVMDVWGMTRTSGAVLGGLLAFDPEVRIAACVLNRVGSRTHAEMVLSALPGHLRELVAGWVERSEHLRVDERHLGLTTVEENPTGAAERARAQVASGRSVDVDGLLAATRTALPGPAGTSADRPARGTGPGMPRARLAVARDAAFCFYYEENLHALEDAGFTLVPFRPTVDPRLPDDTDAVYLGGGYPESFTAELAGNRSLANELRARAGHGMPVYAECGGMMYLARSLTDFDGQRAPMTGILPIDVVMDRQYLSIHYVEVRTQAPSPLGEAGQRARGQEFHQSRITTAEIEPNLYEVTTSTGERRRAGFLLDNVAASYIHLHFSLHPEIPRHFLSAALRYSKKVPAV